MEKWKKKAKINHRILVFFPTIYVSPLKVCTKFEDSGCNRSGEFCNRKGQGSRRVKIGPFAEIYDFFICCRIIYLMKKNVIFICFALKLCDIEADK